MTFTPPKGPNWWQMRTTVEGAPVYKTPEMLLTACCQYFEWVENTPFQEAKAFSYEGIVDIHEIPRKRPATLSGLCSFIGITSRHWRVEWAAKRPDLKPVMDWAEEIIYEHKFSGAAAGFFNANIIARDLGLVDKSEQGGSVVVKIEGPDADL